MFSRGLQHAQSRWKVFDLEAFAVVTALARWRHLLIGVKTTILSDHRGLSCLFRDSPKLTGKAARWVAELLEFDLELRHVSGDSLQVALPDY